MDLKIFFFFDPRLYRSILYTNHAQSMLYALTGFDTMDVDVRNAPVSHIAHVRRRTGVLAPCFLFSTFFLQANRAEWTVCICDVRFSFRCRRQCRPRPATRRHSTTALFSSICLSCRMITARPARAARLVWKVHRSSRRHARHVRDRPRSRAHRIQPASCPYHLTTRMRVPRRDIRRAPIMYPGALKAPSFIPPARNRPPSKQSRGRRASIFWQFFRNPGRYRIATN